MIKNGLKFVKISLIATMALALVGGIFALITQKPFLGGAYVAVMMGAFVPMMGAVLAFAAPSVRIKYMTQDLDENTKGAESFPFAVSGILMMGIAFFLESLMHS